MGSVPESLYTQVLDEKQRLSAALKKLQMVSQKDLRKKYLSEKNEKERFKLLLTESEKKQSIADSQLKHSEFLIKKLVDASRDAISEFNELRQRYVAEVDKRKKAEQQYQQLTIRAQPRSSQKGSVDQLEQELANLRIQLSDTLNEFDQHKEQTRLRHSEMEKRIQEEYTRLKKDSQQLQILLRESHTNAPPPPPERKSSVTALNQFPSNKSLPVYKEPDHGRDSIPPPLTPQTATIHTFEFDDERARKSYVSQKSRENTTGEQRHPFDNSYNRSRATSAAAPAIPISIPAPMPPHSRIRLPEPPPVPPPSSSKAQHSNADDQTLLQNLGGRPRSVSIVKNELMDSNSRMHHVLEKRSTRVLEAAGKRETGSEHDGMHGLTSDDLQFLRSTPSTPPPPAPLHNSPHSRATQGGDNFTYLPVDTRKYTNDNDPISRASVTAANETGGARRSSIKAIESLFSELENELGMKI